METATDCASIVSRSTQVKIGKFLFELANGTRDYRSLHNLTAQVEHQYHGRFAIELLQNAHDALGPGHARVCMAIRDDGLYGTLYVANDGHPFSRSNFESLSQLGNSDKQPQESIGHKGLGFRSVLEITDRPEIFSRRESGSPTFDGYCFGFSPAFVSSLAQPIEALCAGAESDPVPAVLDAVRDWSAAQFASLRQQVAQRAQAAGQSRLDWLRAELAYLSPYLMPQACPENPSAVAEFERAGYATVIRLPLRDAPSRDLAMRGIRLFDAATVMFLDRIENLVLDAGDGAPRTLTRRADVVAGSCSSGTRLAITDDSATRNYLCWRRPLDLRQRDDIRAALVKLPGRWIEMTQADVALGVRTGVEADQGSLSIFLPTRLRSGCAAHINAPFYGDISRTSIDFGDGETAASAAAIYNRYLIGQAAELAIDVIETELAGNGLEQARMVLDLLAPSGNASEYERWRRMLSEAAARRGRDLTVAQWILCDRGWRALRDVVVIPAKSPMKLLHDRVLRVIADFDTLHADLDRRAQFVDLAKREHLTAEPSPPQIAAALEKFVIQSCANSATSLPATFWSDFWSDAESLLGSNGSALKGRRVLLGNDGVLHASGDCAIFFRPRQGASDDEEVDNEQDVNEIPSTLRTRVAFLSDSVPVYSTVDGHQAQTSIRRYLESCELVSRFRREQIFHRVLIPRIRELGLPRRHRTPHAELLRDILVWGLRLAAGRLSRGGEGERLNELLSQLPAPCTGGWFTLGESSFGRGWGLQGNALSTYLRRAATPTSHTARLRLLLTPGCRHWSGRGNEFAEMLKGARVSTGLQPVEQSGSAEFEADKDSFCISVAKPQDWSSANWNSYCADAARNAAPRYKSGPYRLTRIFTLPGVERFGEFDAATGHAFATTILDAIVGWTGDWRTITISRTGSGNSDNFKVMSPLFWLLRNRCWLKSADDDTEDPFAPRQRWYVKQLTEARRTQYSYLRTLPLSLVTRLDGEPALVDLLKTLGMPQYDLQSDNGALQLLRAAADVDAQPVRHVEVFEDQMRSAWRAVSADGGASLPRRLVVRHRGRCTAHEPSPTSPVYLPDLQQLANGVALSPWPQLVIDVADAKRLAERFEHDYPSALVRASRLTVEIRRDGLRWVGDGAEALPALLIDALLAVVAQGGVQRQGGDSDSLRVCARRLQQARIAWSESFEVSLRSDGDSQEHIEQPPAFWSEALQMLCVYASRDALPTAVADALAALLQRDDLHSALCLLLIGFGECLPDEPSVRRALKLLRIDTEQLNAIRHHRRTDVDLVKPYIAAVLWQLSRQHEVAALDAANDMAQLGDSLRLAGLSAADADEVVRIAVSCPEPFEFGRWFCVESGRGIALPEWNHGLVALRSPPLCNEAAGHEFRQSRDASEPAFRRLTGKVLRIHLAEGAAAIGLRNVLDRLRSLSCPADLGRRCWEVGTMQVIDAFIPLWRECGAHDDDVAALLQCVDAPALNAFAAAHADPLECSQSNHSLRRADLERLELIWLAWCVATSRSGKSHGSLHRFVEPASHDEEDIDFLVELSPCRRWRLLQQQRPDDATDAFWQAFDTVKSLDALRDALGLSDSDLANARARFEASRHEENRRRRQVDVCGLVFDPNTDPLEHIWAHLQQVLPVADYGTAEDLASDGALQILGRPSSNSSQHERSGSGSRSGMPRMSQHRETLIGLCGEIHAYRWLQQQYGTTVVSPSAWKSENSRLAGFADNGCTDSYGCDIEICHNGKTLSIEVKSSEADTPQFTMGISEVRLAQRLALQRRSDRKRSFHILRVLFALTASPRFIWLPNPYHRRYEDRFCIDAADVRVSYRPLV